MNKSGMNGSVQTFTTPVDGIYTIHTYGGHGGKYAYGGTGGYSKADFMIKAGQTLYVMVGGSTNCNKPHGLTDYHDGWKPGWNGGGSGQQGPFEYVFTGGGGGTDVRLVSAGKGSTNWTTGINDRIIIAGGAGGSDDMNHELSGRPGAGLVGGGNGGGFVGGTGYGNSRYAGRGANYNQGYALGYGQRATGSCGGAGGGGYYGGYASYRNSGGGGGSAFISGHPQCHTIGTWTSANGLTLAGGNNKVTGYVVFDLQQRIK